MMNTYLNQPFYSPPPAQNYDFSSAGNGRNAMENMPGAMTSNYSHSAVADLLRQNFEYFTSPGTSFASRDSLADVANRPLGNGGYDDQMTLLARDILGRPGLASLFDGVQNGAQEDGLINREDMQLAIGQLSQQEASGYSPMSGNRFAVGNNGAMQQPGNGFSGNYNGAMQQPGNGFSGRYNGAMQQQRINQQFSPQFNAQPASGGPRGMEGWQSQQPQMRAYASQPPSYMGAQGNQQWSPLMAGGRPYANDSDESFSAKVLSHFGALQDPVSGGITDASLSAAASGYTQGGRPVSQADMLVAQELMERGDLFKTLDQGRSGKLDGAISRQDLGDASSQYRTVSDEGLLQAVKDNFRQFTAGGDDNYSNVNELKEAAGLVPSDRTFSPQAREVAFELLNRPGLLRELDIGTNSNGGVGYEDQRFDMANIDYMLQKKSFV